MGSLARWPIFDFMFFHLFLLIYDIKVTPFISSIFKSWVTLTCSWIPCTFQHFARFQHAPFYVLFHWAAFWSPPANLLYNRTHHISMYWNLSVSFICICLCLSITHFTAYTVYVTWSSHACSPFSIYSIYSIMYSIIKEMIKLGSVYQTKF